MQVKRIFLLAIFFNHLLNGASGQTGHNRLWYKTPAEDWNAALPLGNGTLGAMVCGGINKEHIYLNESSVWSGRYHFNGNPGMADKIKEIRELLFSGDYTEAEKLVTKYCTTANDPRYGSYQPLGDLYINFSSVKGEVKNYRRSLNISDATSEVEFSAGNIIYNRKYFISAPAKTMVIKLSCSKKRKLNFYIELGREKGAKVAARRKDGLILYGTNEFGGSSFYGYLKVIPANGKLQTANSRLTVTNADGAVILFTATTDYWGKDQVARCTKIMRSAASKSYQELLTAHIKDYKHYFDRVKIDLGISENSRLPTSERLVETKGANDNDLSALAFQYGRYLLISSSRPGGLPANLQGIWNKDFKPAWFSDFTININFQMNYWPAEVTNLSELTGPMFKQIERMYPAGKKSAKERYGVNGWELGIRSTPWGINELRGQGNLLFQDGAAWLCTHLWEHYLYTKDKVFLKKYYPLIKESARFYDEFLIEDPRYKWLVSGPETSPENKFIGPDGKAHAIDMGTTMSTQIVNDIFAISARAATILNLDKEFAGRLLGRRLKLAPMQIGSKGQLMEWINDYPEIEPQHRHVSHLYGLFPSHQISVKNTPALAKAAKTTLALRGDGGTGWSKAWKVCFWARLLDGDHACKILTEAFNQSTLPNLLSNHPPFQIDGNFGNTAGIAELLLQSDEGEIVLLPALPSAWKTGSVTGLVARGGFIVNIYWANGKLVKATVRAKGGGNCEIRAGTKSVLVSATKNQLISLDGNLKKIKVI